MPRTIHLRAAVTRQMAALLQAGIPLAEALRMIIEQAPDKKIESAFRDIREKVTQGMPFGDAVLQPIRLHVDAKRYLCARGDGRIGGAGPDVTDLLLRWSSGDQGALDALTPVIYDDLRRLARAASLTGTPGA